MKMSKKNIMTRLVAVCAVAGLLLSACGGGSAAKDVDINDLAKSLVNDIAYEETLESASADDMDIELAEGAESVCYMAGYMQAEEVFVCKAADEASATTIKENVSSFLSDQLESVEDYEPAAASRIEKAVLVTKGNYVILCVSNDSDKANEIINNAFK